MPERVARKISKHKNKFLIIGLLLSGQFCWSHSLNPLDYITLIDKEVESLRNIENWSFLEIDTCRDLEVLRGFINSVPIDNEYFFKNGVFHLGFQRISIGGGNYTVCVLRQLMIFNVNGIEITSFEYSTNMALIDKCRVYFIDVGDVPLLDTGEDFQLNEYRLYEAKFDGCLKKVLQVNLNYLKLWYAFDIKDNIEGKLKIETFENKGVIPAHITNFKYLKRSIKTNSEEKILPNYRLRNIWDFFNLRINLYKL